LSFEGVTSLSLTGGPVSWRRGKCHEQVPRVERSSGVVG